MSKCALDIRLDIIDTVGDKLKAEGAVVENNMGYFPNPSKASKAINAVNKEFGELVAKQGEQGSFMIDPSEKLVQDYFTEYNKQLPLFQVEGETVGSQASEATISKVKAAGEAMGISFTNLTDYAKKTGLDITSINGVADLVRGIVAVAEGKENVAITEEMVHIATAILEQTNPSLVTEMISKIGNFKIYKQTLEEYKNNPYYQVNGKPDIRKIKKEAVDKLIAEVIVNKSEGSTEYPELLQEENQSWVRSIWNKILSFFSEKYRKANISIFEEAATKILGEDIGTVSDIAEREIYLQITDNQKSIQQKIQQTRDTIEKIVEKTKETDPELLDTEEANNYYRVKGSLEKITKRVTDRVKAWYKSKFGGKVFSEQEK